MGMMQERKKREVPKLNYTILFFSFKMVYLIKNYLYPDVF